ncbi:MAG: hypothetical protein PF692_07425 [Kiritimatiellae bacterium]|nr:hypothetical protein [Kiritimatiellia bacterium]
MTTDNELEKRFSYDSYTVRKKIFTIFGAAFHIYDPSGQVAFYSKMKGFKLKEDIRLYTEENMTKEILLIQARQVIDFSAAYDIIDLITNEKVGALKRKGMKSIFKDEWIIMNTEDHEIGLIKEDHALLALLRRFLTNLIPQTYYIEMGGKQTCVFKQHFNPFVLKMNIDFTMDNDNTLDRRLGLAASVLLCAIDGRQES